MSVQEITAAKDAVIEILGYLVFVVAAGFFGLWFNGFFDRED